jgi:NAD(P)-dependent dehydrogenase (short-subunit alcohol dehydrogenase family)
VIADVTDRPGLGRAIHDVRAGVGRPTILVNGAAAERFDPFLEITADYWSR